MSILQSLKWINRHGTATALFALLFWLCLAAHTLAINRSQSLAGIPLTSWPERFRRNLVGIQFIHDNAWYVLPYLAFFVGLLIYLEIRKLPRWAVWSAFALLSVPMIAYFLTCIHVGLTPVIVLTASPGP